MEDIALNINNDSNKVDHILGDSSEFFDSNSDNINDKEIISVAENAVYISEDNKDLTINESNNLNKEFDEEQDNSNFLFNCDKTSNKDCESLDKNSDLSKDKLDSNESLNFENKNENCSINDGSQKNDSENESDSNEEIKLANNNLNEIPANNNDDSDNESVISNKSNLSIEKEDEVKNKKIKEVDAIFGDSDSDNEEFEGFGKLKKKVDKSDDEDSDNDFSVKKKSKIFLNDSDDEDKKSESGSENIDEKIEINESDNKEDKNVLPDISSSEDEDDRPSRRHGEDFVYDFDIMMQKRKEQNARNRKRKNIDIINDSDDIIAELIQQMKQAAEDDFKLNRDRKAATRKMKLLPHVQTQLRKIDLREAFLDAGVLSVMTDWLTPLPDRSLPNLQVRETMLKVLLEFSIMDVDRLKAAGIGKAVMYLFKHPKEIKENKKRAGQLISNWSRPIFNCDTDYQTISKEDREQRDFDHMNKMSKRLKTDEQTPKKSNNNDQSNLTLKPGDKGWIPRARVPAPSTKDYVVRPKSTVEVEMSRTNSKKPVSRLEKHLRNFQEKKRSLKSQRAVKISIEGRKL